MRLPKLRIADKLKAPHPINSFPPEFPYRFGEEIVYHLATSSNANIEGSEWERIFAFSIGAIWQPSNIGLDDIRLGLCAWGAKSLKAANPFKMKKVRLISGRNSPSFSFSQHDLAARPEAIGASVLRIWNGRIHPLKRKYPNLRTVVLIKSPDLLKFVVFEIETLPYQPRLYTWRRNSNGNLQGHDRNGAHRFTWQPHGSQFTIIEDVPKRKLGITIKCPSKLPRNKILKAIGFRKSWVAIKKG